MKMDFRGVPGMGKTIEEKMREYNELKGAIQNYSKNKEKYKKESNAQLKGTSWGVVLLIASICILVGSLLFYTGVNGIRRSLANMEYKVYVVAEIDRVWSAMGSSGGSELELKYYVDGKIYKDKITTSLDRDQYMIGESMRVYYYKDNPSNIYLATDEVATYLTPFIGVLLIIGGFVVIFAKIKAGNIKRKR